MDLNVLKLEMVNAFGANFVQKGSRKVQRSFIYLDHPEQTLMLYPVGKHIGIRNQHKNSMTFLNPAENVKEITGLTLSQNRKYLAVHENHLNDYHAWITVYQFISKASDPKLIKSINFSELVYGNLKIKDNQDKASEEFDPQKNIVSLSFSKDNKYMAVLLSDASKDTRALIYDWQSKNKLLYQYEFKDTELIKISFNPKDWT